jgi:ER membrane protein complex subunit 3
MRRHGRGARGRAVKLPFPLTVRFKAMLQRGIETADMDVSWVSSLSWYFLLLFGLRSIFVLFLGDENAADSMRDMQAMGGMAAPGQPVDMTRLFTAEREFLDLHAHTWELVDVERRLLARANGTRTVNVGATSKAKTA